MAESVARWPQASQCKVLRLLSFPCAYLTFRTPLKESTRRKCWTKRATKSRTQTGPYGHMHAYIPMPIHALAVIYFTFFFFSPFSVLFRDCYFSLPLCFPLFVFFPPLRRRPRTKAAKSNARTWLHRGKSKRIYTLNNIPCIIRVRFDAASKNGIVSEGTGRRQNRKWKRC